MITILTHLRTEIYQSSVNILGVPYETQNKVRLSSKATTDTHLPALVKTWSGQRRVPHDFSRGFWFYDVLQVLYGFGSGGSWCF